MASINIISKGLYYNTKPGFSFHKQRISPHCSLRGRGRTRVVGTALLFYAISILSLKGEAYLGSRLAAWINSRTCVSFTFFVRAHQPLHSLTVVYEHASERTNNRRIMSCLDCPGLHTSERMMILFNLQNALLSSPASPLPTLPLAALRPRGRGARPARSAPCLCHQVICNAKERSRGAGSAGA